MELAGWNGVDTLWNAARYDTARNDAERYDAARYDATRHDAERYDDAEWHDVARHDATRYDAKWHDAARNAAWYAARNAARHAASVTSGARERLRPNTSRQRRRLGETHQREGGVNRLEEVSEPTKSG